MTKRLVRIVLDTVLLVGFLAEFITREGPDYAVHSWIGIVLLPIIAFHLATNWKWVVSATRRLSGHPEWPLARFNAAFAGITAICIVTGFPPWLAWSDSGFWALTHTVTGFAAIILMFSHIWRNRSRIGRLLRSRPAAT